MAIGLQASTDAPGPPAEPLPPAVPTVPIYRLSVAQYHGMIASGLLAEDAPVELLEGWLVEKMPKTLLHRAVTYRLRKALERVVPAGAYVDAQEPLTTLESEPEPDLMVVRGSSDDYRDRHPGPADLLLVVEVASSSLERDRTLKRRIYARAGVPIYWIVNLVDRLVEVHTDPTGPAEEPDYRSRRVVAPGEPLPLVLDGRELARLDLAELLA